MFRKMKIISKQLGDKGTFQGIEIGNKIFLVSPFKNETENVPKKLMELSEDKVIQMVYPIFYAKNSAFVNTYSMGKIMMNSTNEDLKKLGEKRVEEQCGYIHRYFRWDIEDLPISDMLKDKLHPQIQGYIDANKPCKIFVNRGEGGADNWVSHEALGWTVVKICKIFLGYLEPDVDLFIDLL